MKRILIPSIVINILCASYFGYKLYIRKPGVLKSNIFASVRKDIQSKLPVDSNDIVFIGNSITDGFPVTELFGIDYKNRGISGNTSIQVLERVPGIVMGKPAKIFLMIGVNDIKAGHSLDSIILNTSKIVDVIRKGSPITKIFIQSVLPTCGEYDMYSDVIKEYNGMLKSYCQSKGLTYINIHKLMEQFKPLSYDGLHLNARGYDIWRNEIVKYFN